MKNIFISALLFIWLGAAALAQQTPHLAYVYPAGGRQGATLQVTVGGQFLGTVSNALVSGAGLRASVVEYDRPMNMQYFGSLRTELQTLQTRWQAARQDPHGTNVWTAADRMRFEELRAKILKNPPNRDANPALAETVLLNLSIATNAAPGQHEIRLFASNGLSNPLNFCVGQWPEFSKPPARSTAPELVKLIRQLGGNVSTNTTRTEFHVALPAVVNGQILPGGEDCWWFSAAQGQQLVVSVAARALIPYLADAVPGWFEPTLTVYDARGKEIAYDNRFRFRPDPLLHFEVPATGNYCIVIHDSIYRGREDFVYRMTIGELPLVTDIFPLGGPAGEKTTVTLTGWNLPARTLTVDNLGKAAGLYPLPVSADETICNPLPFAVDTLPEGLNQGENHSPETAQAVTLPIIINGRINSPGDEDIFRFTGRVGEQVVAEVLARRLGSPLDSTLELTDASGKRLAFNDDFDDEGAGLETDHADSYLTATLPADGTYFIRLCDAQNQGGPAYAYRLRLSEPRPDFALRVVPSSLMVRAGMGAPVTVYALRRDGFTNAIELSLKDAPPGFSLSGARLPADQDQVQVTLKAPAQAGKQLTALTLEGRAVLAGQEVVHPAVPAERMMQAFAYWHLVPVQTWAVAVVGTPRSFTGNGLKILSALPVTIPLGGTARVRVATPSPAFTNRFDVELNDAPEAISIESITPAPGGIEIVLRCRAGTAGLAMSGNLTMNIIRKNQAPSPGAPRPGKQRRTLVGSLPAISYAIVPD